MAKQFSFTSVIVDDEPKSVVLLQRMLERYCPEVEVVGTANSTKKAYEVINSLAPSLVFLDVEMPDGSGFHLLKNFPAFLFAWSSQQLMINMRFPRSVFPQPIICSSRSASQN